MGHFIAVLFYEYELKWNFRQNISSSPFYSLLIKHFHRYSIWTHTFRYVLYFFLFNRSWSDCHIKPAFNQRIQPMAAALNSVFWWAESHRCQNTMAQQRGIPAFTSLVWMQGSVRFFFSVRPDGWTKKKNVHVYPASGESFQTETRTIKTLIDVPVTVPQFCQD